MLFIIYGEIGERIVKRVGITYEIINYTSPTHTKETSEVWHRLFTPLKITKLEKENFILKIDQKHYNGECLWTLIANVI